MTFDEVVGELKKDKWIFAKNHLAFRAYKDAPCPSCGGIGLKNLHNFKRQSKIDGKWQPEYRSYIWCYDCRSMVQILETRETV